MTNTYEQILERIARGEIVTPAELNHAQAADQARAETAANNEKLNADVESALEAWGEYKASVDADHLPIIAEMIEDLQAAHVPFAEAHQAYKAARSAYEAASTARNEAYVRIFQHVHEVYGTRTDTIDHATGENHWTSWVEGRSIVVNGATVNMDGTTTPLD